MITHSSPAPWPGATVVPRTSPGSVTYTTATSSITSQRFAGSTTVNGVPTSPAPWLQSSGGVTSNIVTTPKSNGELHTIIPPTAGSLSATSPREQILEQRVRELEALVAQKDRAIEELRACLKATTGGGKNLGPGSSSSRTGLQGTGTGGSGVAAIKRGSSGEARPSVKYVSVEQDDPIDVRLEEFYNSTGSAIPFRRINRGFYRFGETICEVDIINHKLMARTEDGWNHSKFGPIEKFLVHYEGIERQKRGIPANA